MVTVNKIKIIACIIYILFTIYFLDQAPQFIIKMFPDEYQREWGLGSMMAQLHCLLWRLCWVISLYEGTALLNAVVYFSLFKLGNSLFYLIILLSYKKEKSKKQSKKQYFIRSFVNSNSQGLVTKTYLSTKEQHTTWCVFIYRIFQIGVLKLIKCQVRTPNRFLFLI